MKLYDGFAILGMLMVALVVLAFLAIIFHSIRETIAETRGEPVDYKTPVRFLKRLWENIEKSL